MVSAEEIIEEDKSNGEGIEKIDINDELGRANVSSGESMYPILVINMNKNKCVWSLT